MSPNLSPDFWPKIDQAIFAAFDAIGREDYETANACYQNAILEAGNAAQELAAQVIENGGPGAGGNATKIPATNGPAGVGTAYTPPAHYGLTATHRAVPEDTAGKERDLANALKSVAVAQQQVGDMRGASETFERVAELLSSFQGPTSGQAAWYYYCAALLGDQSAPRREHLYRHALEIFGQLEKNGITTTADRCACLAGLGFFLTEQGRQAEAFQVVSQAIDALEAPSNDRPEVPPFLAITLAKLVNGGVLHKRLVAVCKATGRTLPSLAGLPSRRKQLGSLCVTVAFFWFIFGSPAVAASFLILLLVHEMGHYLAARQVGVAVTPPVFTPLGAVITMLTQPKSCREEAYFAIAGPAAGTVGALIAFYIGIKLQIYFLAEAAKYAFALNLFNLIPLAPMDGGRISMAISRHMWILGLALYALVGFAVLYFSFISIDGGMPTLQRVSTLPLKVFLLYWLGRSAWLDLKERWKMARTTPEYFSQAISLKFLFATCYLGLAALLFMVLGFESEFAQLISQN
ncbi:MAG: site-2 protease family protein [Cyanobacteria bacterium SZAS TMP-1]|nr:site-2 protease family protein [Cyanobacteria bacterium SZAS TMP-1]